MFIRDMEAIDKLRADAVNSLEAHNSGIRKLTAYAAQLVWMGGKFPIDVSKLRTQEPKQELKDTRQRSEGLTRDILDRRRFFMVPCTRFQHSKAKYVNGSRPRYNIYG